MRSQISTIQKLLQMSLMRSASFSSDFIFGILSAVLWLGIPIVFFKMIYLNVDTIAGWSWYQTLLLVGIYTMVDGLMMTFLVQNLPTLEHDIREGQLDSILLKPIDTQLYYFFYAVDFTQLVNFIFGLTVTIYALIHLSINWLYLPIALLCMLAGCILYYAIWFLWTITVFWLPTNFGRSDLFLSMIQMGRYPNTIYRGFGKLLFLVILPVGMIATPTALALLGRLTWFGFLGVIVLALVSLVLSRLVWLCGLRRYDGAGR